MDGASGTYCLWSREPRRSELLGKTDKGCAISKRQFDSIANFVRSRFTKYVELHSLEFSQIYRFVYAFLPGKSPPFPSYIYVYKFINHFAHFLFNGNYS